MAINTKAAPSTATTSAMAAGIASHTNDLIELSVIKRVDATPTEVSTTTPILKRKGGGGSKRLQFSTPECSVTPIANTVPRCVSPRLIPSRKRYEYKYILQKKKNHHIFRNFSFCKLNSVSIKYSSFNSLSKRYEMRNDKNWQI